MATDPYANLDPVSYKAVTGRDKPGAPKPKATPKPASAAPPARSPLLDLAHKAVDIGGTALFPIPHMAGQQIGQGLGVVDQLTHGSVSHAMKQGMDIFDAPWSALGASLRDAEEGHNPFDPSKPGPHVRHFKDLIGKGKFDEARAHYSLLDLGATKERAQATGDPVAKFALHHPSWFGAAGGVAENVNPMNIAAGFAGGELMDALSMGARKLGIPGVDRWSDIEGAAVREGNVAPKEAASRASAAATKLATSAQYGKGKADDFVRDLFTMPGKSARVGKRNWSLPGKRMTLDQQHELVEYIEGEKALPIPGSRAWNAMSDADRAHARIMEGKRDKYRAFMRDLDQKQVDAGLDPARLWKGGTYFPRKGFAKDPLTTLDEEVQEQLRLHRTGGPGGPSYRFGTAGQNAPHRTYRSYKQAKNAGVELNPEWRPSQALHEHISQRMQNVRINEALEHFEDLGLIEPKATSTRTDFGPFTQFGDVRGFGAPLTREGSVHTSIVRLIKDLQPAGGEQGVATLGSAAAQTLPFVARQAARAEVTNPIYHPLVNLLRNYMAGKARGEGGSLRELAKSFLPGYDTESAMEAGATAPHVSAMPMGQRVLKFGERAQGPTVGPFTSKLLQAFEHPFNMISSEPVYRYFEPRMGAAYYKSLRKQGFSEAEAVNKTRMMLGKPEGIAAGEKAMSQSLIFPSWMKSMAQFWTNAVARNPALYVGPHRAAQAHNLAYGVGPQSSDPYKMIPNIALTKATDEKGATMLPIPHPFNRLGSMLRFAMPDTSAIERADISQTFLNPVFSAIAKAYTTAAGKPELPGFSTLFDKDAPAGEQWKSTQEQLGAGVTPLRQSALAGGAGALLGLTPYQMTTKGESAANNMIQKMFRAPIGMLRYQAKQAYADGQTQLGKSYDKQADDLYYRMVETLKERQPK